MNFQVATGKASSLDARDAATQATQMALEQLGKKTIALGFVIASYHFPFQQLLSGITPLLGDTPLIGFSTTSELSPESQEHRSVSITLLSGNDIQARTDWWPPFENNIYDIQKAVQTFQLSQSQGFLLVAADGYSSDAHTFCTELPEGSYVMAGCLAAGDTRRQFTSQIGGKKTGRGGLAAGLLTGNFSIGIGFSQAWKPVGAYFTVTGSKDLYISTLDHQAPSEIYSQLFGYTSQDWVSSPLNELVRLYPLGIEHETSSDLLVRSPLRIESDGSLRMNAPVPEGSIGHFMVGGIQASLGAAADASRQALTQLGNIKPLLALVFADISIQMLLEAQSGSVFETIKSILGSQVPVVGGYTFGQLVRQRTGTPELLNQHITVVVLGENDQG